MITVLLPLLLAVPLSGEGDLSPVPQEKKVVVRTGPEKRGFLGVQIRDLDKEKKGELKVKTDEGALVVEVTAKSPAEKAGIVEDDVIVQFDGRTIYDSDDLIKAVRRVAPGTETTVILERKGEKKTLKVTVGKQKGMGAFSFTVPTPAVPRALRSYRVARGKAMHIGEGVYGMQLHELTPQLRKYFGAPEGEGILVEEVENESEAAKAGFQAGDVILRIGTEPIEEMGDIWDGLEDFKKGEKAEVDVLRKGSRTKLSLPVEEELSWHEGSLPGIYHLKGLERLKELEHLEQEQELEHQEQEQELEHQGQELEQNLEHLRPNLERLRMDLNGMRGGLREAMENLRVTLKRRLERVTV